MSTEGHPGGASSPAPASARDRGFDPQRPWRLHPRVAVRPEPFGALLYHYGTRRLTFLKDPRLLEAVTSLDDHTDALAACRAAGVAPEQQPAFTAALGRLAHSDMLVCDPEEGDRP